MANIREGMVDSFTDSLVHLFLSICASNVQNHWEEPTLGEFTFNAFSPDDFPNIEFEDYKVSWYKNIGRSMEHNFVSETDLVTWFCRATQHLNEQRRSPIIPN